MDYEHTNIKLFHWFNFSVGGTNSKNTHYFAKYRNWWELIFLLSDTKFMDACSFIIYLKKINMYSKMVLEKLKYIYKHMVVGE